MSDWTDHAACLGRPTSWWYPGQGDRFGAEVAVAICRTCPVRRACLDDALAHELSDGLRFGIVGGLTADQRDQLVATVRVA